MFRINIKVFKKYNSLDSLKKEFLPLIEEKLQLTDQKINPVAQDLLQIFLAFQTLKGLEGILFEKKIAMKIMMKYLRDLIR